MSYAIHNLGLNDAVQFVGLSKPLNLNELIAKKDQIQVLNFLKTSLLDLASWSWKAENGEEWNLVRLCHEKAWMDILDWLYESQRIDFLPELVRAISLKQGDYLRTLLKCFKEDMEVSISGTPYETLLWHALNERNYDAARMLIEKGASLSQPLPMSLQTYLKEELRKSFFSHPFYFGRDGEELLRATEQADVEDSLVYAMARYYYPQDSKVLELLLEYPKAITFNVVKAFVQLADVTAFNRVLSLYLQPTVSALIDQKSSGDMDLSLEKKKRELLHYVLRDYHFSLMGFHFDYVIPRLEIMKALLALNPCLHHVDKFGLSTYEIAQYLQLCVPQSVAPEFEPIWVKLLQDPTGFHDLWRIQRLLFNMLGAKVNALGKVKDMQVAAYPNVLKHMQDSFAAFLENNRLNNDCIFVTPQPQFSLDKCLQWLDEKKILKIFTGWTGGDDEGHAVNALLYEDYLFICNRGGGSTLKTSGVAIYRLEDVYVRKECLQICLERSKRTEHFVKEGILTHAKIKHLHTLSASPQQTGNCVWLSEKMGIYACFVAMALKQGLPMEVALTHGKSLFKQWSVDDRFRLLHAYLDHPYHSRKDIQPGKDGIDLKQVIKAIIRRAPKRLKSKYASIILQKLEKEEFKKYLSDDEFKELYVTLKMHGYERALIHKDTGLAVSYLKDIFKEGCEIKSGEILLNLACNYKNFKVIQELLERGVNPTYVTNDALSPLEALLKESEREDGGLPRLQEEANIIKLLVKHTCLEELAMKDVFPLHTAITYGHEVAVEEILSKGFDPLCPNEKGETAYHFAAMSKYEQLGIALLNKCPNLNLKTKNGKTPLHLAVNHRNANTVSYLLNHGADPNAKTPFHITPLDEVLSDEWLPVCKLLLKHGADVNRHTSKANTPLMTQILQGNEAIVEEILKVPNVNIHVINKNGVTPLHLAVDNDMKDVVSALLKKGADPNAICKQKLTPLHHAAMGNKKEICQILLAFGARKDMPSKKGLTPIDCALLNKNDSLIELFKAKSSPSN